MRTGGFWSPAVVTFRVAGDVGHTLFSSSSLHRVRCAGSAPPLPTGNKNHKQMLLNNTAVSPWLLQESPF